MSAYEFAGGSLKLKGVSDKISKKKKKKSKKDKKDVEKKLLSVEKIQPTSSENNLDSQDSQNSVKSTDSIKLSDKLIENKVDSDGKLIVKKPAKTKSELAYEKAIERRNEQRILSRAEMSHKDRVEVFNKKLDSLSEYNDVPKVSWTK